MVEENKNTSAVDNPGLDEQDPQDNDPERVLATQSQFRTQGLFPTTREWKMMEWMAKNFYAAGAIPKGLDTVAKVIVAIQAGSELGITPVQALGCIALINGKPMVYGNMPIALAMKAGHRVQWGECDETKATVTITRKEGASETKTLTIEEAKKKGLTNGQLWPKYPDRMLRYAVYRSIAVFLLADLYNGVAIGEDEQVMYEIIDESNKNIATVGAPARVSTTTVKRPTLAESVNKPLATPQAEEITKPLPKKEKKPAKRPDMDGLIQAMQIQLKTKPDTTDREMLKFLDAEGVTPADQIVIIQEARNKAPNI